MINVRYNSLGILLEDNIKELDFHKGTVRNSLIRVSFTEVKVRIGERGLILDNICNYLANKFPKYRFYHHNNCPEVEIEQNVQYLKRIQCQIFW